MSVESTRRHMLKLLGGSLLLTAVNPTLAFGETERPILTKPIPQSHTSIPVIGMGTWRTFNVGRDQKLLRNRTQVLKAFFSLGGRLIDCSPMYGSSSSTLGYALNQLTTPDDLFAAEKVWTGDEDATRQQIQTQLTEWKIDQFELIQIHNLLEWKSHLPVLRDMKREGKIRYIGITTSHGRRHSELEQIMLTQELDFVQLTYNLTHRDVEHRLLPLAREKGIAVIANRPYDGGQLIRSLKNQQPVPTWATADLGCQTWAEFLLKFIVSHPAVTCAIPATTNVTHMEENMLANRGALPDHQQRIRMVKDIETL